MPAADKRYPFLRMAAVLARFLAIVGCAVFTLLAVTPETPNGAGFWMVLKAVSSLVGGLALAQAIEILLQLERRTRPPEPSPPTSGAAPLREAEMAKLPTL